MPNLVPSFPPCPTCGSKAGYDEKFDAAFCPSCNVWLERGCKDPECEFCTQRPERPRALPAS